jgi:hypothetical protein
MNKKRKEMIIGDMQTTISILKIKETLVDQGVSSKRTKFLLTGGTKANAIETNILISYTDISDELIGDDERWEDKQSGIDFFKQSYDLSHINDSIDDYVIKSFFNPQSLGIKIGFKPSKKVRLITFNKPFLCYKLNRSTSFTHHRLASIEETLKNNGYNLTEDASFRSESIYYVEYNGLNPTSNLSIQKIYQKGESTIITKNWFRLFQKNNIDYSRKGYSNRTNFAFVLAYNESTDNDIILEIRNNILKSGLKNNNGNISTNIVESIGCYKKRSNMLNYLSNIIDDKIFYVSLAVKKMLSKYLG